MSVAASKEQSSLGQHCWLKAKELALRAFEDCLSDDNSGSSQQSTKKRRRRQRRQWYELDDSQTKKLLCISKVMQNEFAEKDSECQKIRSQFHDDSSNDDNESMMIENNHESSIVDEKRLCQRICLSDQKGRLYFAIQQGSPFTCSFTNRVLKTSKLTDMIQDFCSIIWIVHRLGKEFSDDDGSSLLLSSSLEGIKNDDYYLKKRKQSLKMMNDDNPIIPVIPLVHHLDWKNTMPLMVNVPYMMEVKLEWDDPRACMFRIEIRRIYDKKVNHIDKHEHNHNDHHSHHQNSDGIEYSKVKVGYGVLICYDVRKLANLRYKRDILSLSSKL